jgi:hypothetical protein
VKWNWGMIVAWAIGAAGVMAAEPAPDGSDAGSKPAAGSLDQLLLDDLDNRLLEGLDFPSAKPMDDPDGSKPEVPPLDQLGWGEDLGSESSDPFLVIGRQMRTAEELIGRRDTSEATRRVQRQIVEDLERLIEQMNKQCGGQQGTSSQKSSRGEKQPKPGGKTGSGEHPGTSKPARDSETQVGQRESDDERLFRMRETLAEVWGHLPARVREQMQSGMAEEFLPKYERLIEQYYQRLAEERARR